MSYLKVLQTYFLLSLKVYVGNRRYTNKCLKEVFKKLNLGQDSIPPALLKKIHFYTMQSCMVSSWTVALRGYGLSAQEKRNATFLGIITPILDDLTDELQLTTPEIFYVLRNTTKEVNGELAIARYLYEQLQSIKNPLFNEVFEQTLLAQESSIVQFDKTRQLAFEELKGVTRKKGGLATLLYRVVLCSKLKEGEKEAFMTLGYSLQQLNDMFDVYKDSQNSQQTNFTNTTDITKNNQEYQETLDGFTEQFLKLDYHPKNIIKCLLEISTITSRGKVCLEQLEQLKNPEKAFRVSEFTRSQLVCDMEKPVNIKKSVGYSTKFYGIAQRMAQEVK